jgi:hypothetical protein
MAVLLAITRAFLDAGSGIAPGPVVVKVVVTGMAGVVQKDGVS